MPVDNSAPGWQNSKMGIRIVQEAAKSSPYSIVFGFEDNFDVPGSVRMFNDFWWCPFAVALLVYLPVVYLGQLAMASREAFKLRLPLIVWNIGLGLFSTIGFLRSIPEMAHVLNKFGFQHSICNNSYMLAKPSMFWFFLFTVSKTPELVDTLFLVLKKQRIIFLHVYHHATVVVFAYFVYADTIAASRWFTCMNYGVHSIMYTYYALKALPDLVRIPKWVSMLITSLQILQMVVGSYVVGAASYTKLLGRHCDINTRMSIMGLTIYLSYLVLFSHFFYKAYLAPAPAKSRAISQKKVD